MKPKLVPSPERPGQSQPVGEGKIIKPCPVLACEDGAR
jgi:hypothetical protein